MSASCWADGPNESEIVTTAGGKGRLVSPGGAGGGPRGARDGRGAIAIVRDGEFCGVVVLLDECTVSVHVATLRIRRRRVSVDVTEASVLSDELGLRRSDAVLVRTDAADRLGDKDRDADGNC